MIVRGISQTNSGAAFGGYLEYTPDGSLFSAAKTAADAQAAEAVAQRVTEAVASVGRKFDPAKPVTASTGIARALDNDSVASHTRRADDACYRAKTAGGNRVIAA